VKRTGNNDAALRRTEALRRSLREWYLRERRDLPWRRSRDAYAIWISEVMLQQTTVAAVIPYWERFLAAFPTLADLAAADEQDVLRLWSGLGYYRRARGLLEAARAVAEAGGTTLPADAASLRRLPGIGPYTAGAIASIAFGEAVPAVDGNVVRVLARLDARPGDPARQPTKRQLEERAAELVDPAFPGDHNQALMELGATVCTPRAPRCLVCPWREGCRARSAGEPERYPETAPRREPVDVVRAAVRVRDPDGRVLLSRVPSGLPNEGLWELPSVDLFHGARDEGRPPERLGEDDRARVVGELRASRGVAVRLGPRLDGVRHGITHHRITVHLFAAELEAASEAIASTDRDAWRFVDESRALEEALTAATRKLLGARGGRCRTTAPATPPARDS
jgi:A/G-specific adenine glycosylase